MLLMIDNYDSFTYNLVQYFGDLGVSVKVVRNDKITLDRIERLSPRQIVISPGPGRPDNAGISKQVIAEFAGRIPMLGVCLGHQCIGEAFGARVIRAGRIMHGKVSHIRHFDSRLFSGIPQGFEATRYHSLIIDPRGLPDCLDITATTEHDEIMGLSHKQFFVEGIQFHPESILTDQGRALLHNFIRLSDRFRANRTRA